MIRLKEMWQEPKELQPRVFIGEAMTQSRLMRFLDDQMMPNVDRIALKRGKTVALKRGDVTYLLEIVPRGTLPGMFHIGKDGLEAIK
jgi:hypothetical protein